jgi:hypothetical protein
VAENCCVLPLVTDGFVGVTAIEARTGAVTVSVADPEIVPEVALIVAVPCPVPVASPELFSVATARLVEPQAALEVRSCVVLSVYVPVAVNCWVLPLGTDGFTGVTAIDTNAGGATVRVVVPTMEPEVALMFVLPCSRVVANPVLLIVATVCCDDCQVTEFVRFCWLPSV